MEMDDVVTYLKSEACVSNFDSVFYETHSSQNGINWSPHPCPVPNFLCHSLPLFLELNCLCVKNNFLTICRNFSPRCYLVDNLANLVTDPDFLLVSTTDAREYERVSLGRKEGDIMKLLVTKHKFFVPNQRVDFQGICSVSPYAPKVSPYKTNHACNRV